MSLRREETTRSDLIGYLELFNLQYTASTYRVDVKPTGVVDDNYKYSFYFDEEAELFLLEDPSRLLRVRCDNIRPFAPNSTSSPVKIDLYYGNTPTAVVYL